MVSWVCRAWCSLSKFVLAPSLCVFIWFDIIWRCHYWGVHHRLSSVAFPHSNCRAEINVKTIKRLIAGNVGNDGTLDIDTFQRAILQYRNTPDPSTKMSPATCLFGRSVKDLIPILPGKYCPHATWKESLQLREEALCHGHQEKWTEHTKAYHLYKLVIMCGFKTKQALILSNGIALE